MIHNKESTNPRRATHAIALALLLKTSVLAADESSSEHSQKFYDLFPLLAWPLAAIAIVTLILLAYAVNVRRKPEAIPEKSTDTRFSPEHITNTFISAIPSLTQELNLEVATSEQMETFEKTHAKSILWGWVNLGVNIATVRVPVTYRFHVRLYDAWCLEVKGSTLLVTAPCVSPSLPPAFHSHRMEVQSSRGWGRLAPNDLVSDLQRDLTPTLSQYAGDHRRIGLVRETCRVSVAEFIEKWLEGDSRWKPGAFITIHVRFADETHLPSTPTPNLLK